MRYNKVLSRGKDMRIEYTNTRALPLDYKGIKSELSFWGEKVEKIKGFRNPTKDWFLNQKEFRIIIDFLLNKYSLKTFDCEILLTLDRDQPYYLDKKIYLVNKNKEDGSVDEELEFHQMYDYQFSHELIHHIQELQSRGSGGEKYPPKHMNETEAVANSIWIIEKVLNFHDYNARARFCPEYYDYDEAERLVDSNEISKFWNNQ
jgi:hypothetical protein